MHIATGRCLFSRGKSIFKQDINKKIDVYTYLFIYLFTIRDLSLERDKIYSSTRFLLLFLLQNNETFIVYDKKPNLKPAELSCIKHAKLL